MTDPFDTAPMIFEVAKAALGGGTAARLGRLSIPNRAPVDTPNYFANTSRGAVPHLAPDVVSKHTTFTGAYMAYEDFADSSRGPVFSIQRAPSTPLRPPLHTFTALPSAQISVLGARRVPCVAAPMKKGNTKDHVTVFSATGFHPLRNAAYLAAVRDLRPDIVLPLADVGSYGGVNNKNNNNNNNASSPGNEGAAADGDSDDAHHPAAAGSKTTTPAAKRAVKMVDRTGEWAEQFVAGLAAATSADPTASSPPPPPPAIFAPILPLPVAQQWDWLVRLADEDDLLPHVSGLALHDASVLPGLAVRYPALAPLARLSVDHHRSSDPRALLALLAAGVDLFVLPFVDAASDAGVALCFEFPAPPPPPPSATTTGTTTTTPLLPLGLDMWHPAHAADPGPLTEGCGCYACARHHRAYVRHLLDGREMLAWTLLQVHNHAVVARFFAGVRRLLGSEGGGERFEAERKRFADVYEPDLPRGSGSRPRARGYHFKSEGGDAPINKPAWRADLSAVGGEEEPGVGGVEGAVELDQEKHAIEELAEMGILEIKDTEKTP